MSIFWRLVPIAPVVFLLAVPAGAAAGPSERRAERAVRAALLARFHAVDAVRCRAPRGRARRRRARTRCSWRAHRRPTPNRLRRCRGYYLARARGRRVRLRRRRGGRCRDRLTALAPWLGFNDNAIRAGQISPENDARLTEEVGAGIHRLTFDWRRAEPRPGDFRLADYDRIYNAMLGRGIRPLFALAFAPDWARDVLSLCYGDCRYPPARDRYPEWRRIAGLLATRYPRAAGIEVWNEPNEHEFWHPGPDPSRYAELLAEAHRGVKEANRSMPVLTGGFSNRGRTEGPNIGLREFLEGIYRAGARGRFDALSFHAYPITASMPTIPRTLAAVTQVPARFGDANVPLWATETGLSTTDPDHRSRVSEREQASALLGTIRALRKGGVRVVLVHTLLENERAGSRRGVGWGLVTEGGRRKPAFCALAREAGVPVAPRGCER